MRKNEIIRIVTEHMIDEHIFGKEALDDLPTESTDMSAVQTELEKWGYKLSWNWKRLELSKRLG